LGSRGAPGVESTSWVILFVSLQQPNSVRAGAASPLFGGVRAVIQTPFSVRPSDGEAIAWDDLARLTAYAVDAGVTGVVTLGLASEAGALSDTERDRVSAMVVEVVARRVPIVFGIDGPAHVACERACRAAELGATGLMVLPPRGIADPDLIVEHMRRVAEASRLPILAQDSPQVTGVHLDVSVLDRMRRHVQAVKVEAPASGPKISRLLASGFEVVAGWGGLHYLEAIERGAVGVMPGCDLAAQFIRIDALARAGDSSSALAAYREILPLLAYETSSLDLLVRGSKRALVRRGVIASDLMRHPGGLLDERQLQSLDALLDALDDFAARA
jgi:dihydrodipicolinate synthase/N-acetylneuraminate lyase